MRKCVLLPVLLALFAGCSDSGEAAMDTSEPWDLVWFSDSTGFGLAEMWGERIHDELGVEVVVHDFASGGLRATEVLEWIGDGENSLPKVKDSLAEADVIVLYGNPEQSGVTADIDTCVSTDQTPRPAPTRNSLADWQPYADVLSQIYDIIFDLRDGKPTIVRAMDMYNPVIADWREAGIEPECTGGWEMMAQTVADTAARYDVPTVSMYDAFNGVDHTEDPRVKGYILSDGQHATQEGRAAQVDVLDGMGYDPIGT